MEKKVVSVWKEGIEKVGTILLSPTLSMSYDGEVGFLSPLFLFESPEKTKLKTSQRAAPIIEPYTNPVPLSPNNTLPNTIPNPAPMTMPTIEPFLNLL